MGTGGTTCTGEIEDENIGVESSTCITAIESKDDEKMLTASLTTDEKSSNSDEEIDDDGGPLLDDRADTFNVLLDGATDTGSGVSVGADDAASLHKRSLARVREGDGVNCEMSDAAGLTDSPDLAAASLIRLGQVRTLCPSALQ